MSSLTLPVRKSRYCANDLGDRHREMIRLSVLGVPVHEIAEKMECGRHHVRYIINSPLGVMLRKELMDRRDDSVADISTRLAEMCPKAIDVLQEVMNGNDVQASLALRVKVCESILDRAGYGKVTKTENKNLNTSLTAEDIMELQRSARAEAKAVGILSPCVD